MTKLCTTKKFQSLVDSGNHVDKARLIACKANKASRWMQAAPEGEKILSDEVCRTAIRLRLGIKKTSVSHSVRCVCGRDVRGGALFHLHTY